MKYSFIATFKNRDENRIRLFLDSLEQQQNPDFELLFINQGSDEDVNAWIDKVVAEYSFAKYFHNRTEGYLWNKGNALNIGIKSAVGDYIIIADIDLIYLPDYLDRVDKLLQPDSFITHNVYYLTERFSGYHPTQIPDRQKPEAFTEAFHSACVANREVLMDIKGFDEYYMVWGVEDDDIVRALQEADQKRLHLTAPELPIYHQWHPSAGFTKATLWYLNMVDHLYSAKRNDSCNTEWGKHFQTKDRPIFKFIDQTAYAGYNKLAFDTDHSLYFFNPFLQTFHAMRPGEVASITFNAPYAKPGKKRSFFLKNVEAENTCIRPSTKDIVDFFHFFIGSRRELMEDYYFRHTGNEFLFVVIKGSPLSKAG